MGWLVNFTENYDTLLKTIIETFVIGMTIRPLLEILMPAVPWNTLQR